METACKPLPKSATQRGAWEGALADATLPGRARGGTESRSPPLLVTSGPAAILIVNGGRDPEAGRWIELCLDQLRRHTTRPDVAIHVWNNNVDDPAVPEIVARHPDARLVQADPEETLAHPHATPLQRLYERVRDDVAWIVALDSDAFPVRPGWLEALIEGVAGPGLGGVWRDELRQGIVPYVHASCLCARVDFIEKHGLRLDHVSSGGRGAHRLDTLGLFTKVAREQGITPFKWRRSNRREIHRLMGGVYGDWIYHHGAGSRVGVGFWDEVATEERRARNLRVRDRAAELVFRHRERYLAWLRGSEGPEPPAFLFVLGMHRSGTSCLAGSLERCGVHLGDVSRENPHNRKGNHELRAAVALDDAILADNGGRWDAPPREVEVAPARRAEMARIVEGLRARRPAGLKDPRALLALDAWVEAAPQPGFVGSFRHPRSVADSLGRRSGLSEEASLALWRRYNQELVERHRRRPFPLVEFDLGDVERYLRCVLHAAWLLGLHPDPEALGGFVTPEMDAAPAGDAPVPESCRPLHDYLRAHAVPPHASDPFVDAILDIWTAQAAAVTPAAAPSPTLPPAPIPQPESGWRRWIRRLRPARGDAAGSRTR